MLEETQKWLAVEGQPVVPHGSLDDYFYEVDEAALPHPVIARFARGEEVGAAELHTAAVDAVREVAHSEPSVSALEAVRLRLSETFPRLIDAEPRCSNP